MEKTVWGSGVVKNVRFCYVHVKNGYLLCLCVCMCLSDRQREREREREREQDNGGNDREHDSFT